MQRACFSRLDCCNLPSAIVPKAVEFALRLSHIGRQLTLAPVVHISERDGSHNLARRHRRRGSFSAGVGSQIFQENTRRKPTADAGTFQVSGLVEKNKPLPSVGSVFRTKCAGRHPPSLCSRCPCPHLPSAPARVPRYRRLRMRTGCRDERCDMGHHPSSLPHNLHSLKPHLQSAAKHRFHSNACGRASDSSSHTRCGCSLA